MKKILVYTLTFVLAMGLVMPSAYAGTEDAVDLPETAGLPLSALYGLITEAAEDRVKVRNIRDENDSIIFLISTRTVIIDAVTGLPATIKDRKSDRVLVYYGPFVALSEPPFGNAAVIAVNLPEGISSPHYSPVESVEWADGDTLKIWTDSGGAIIALNRETPLLPYLTRQMVILESIKKGDVLLLWYEIMAMSYPGQATAQKAVLIYTAPAEKDETPVSIIGNTAPKEINGVPMYPVRRIFENAGFSVTWEKAINAAVITGEANRIVITPGKAAYIKNDAVISLSAAIHIESGNMYAPADLFDAF